eukprot:CAMPEP_0183824094 /NCGR_PEP_ID=MMETSP0807_2-20130328/400_1 /TAXON_ID=88271 /ORGANISM="Picocystis salinarum, Strain CCMP1897" /LENGTH=485 /DNA_ID=CAMNT_0026069005 /DNA_START=152 /DNA_END=1609 /DNA_ORIENTATION=-
MESFVKDAEKRNNAEDNRTLSTHHPQPQPESTPQQEQKQHMQQQITRTPSAAKRELAPVLCATLNALSSQPVDVSHVRGPSIQIIRTGEKEVEVTAEFAFRAQFDTREGADTALRKAIEKEGCENGHTLNAVDPSGSFREANGKEKVVCQSEEEYALQARARLWEIHVKDVTVKKRLSVGGFAEVFLAQYHGTAVAIKRFFADEDECAKEQFQTEVALLARLRHPNLILFMGYTIHPYLSIMSEFMGRGSLFDVLRRQRGKPLDIDKQRVVALSVARGMAYLHSRSPPILHMDLKSPNILVDERWRVKITDFGLSRVRKRTYVTSGGGEGTPEWMAPEVLRNEPFDEKADVYSYGVVLWETCTGLLPWEELRPMQVVGAVGFQGRQLPVPEEGDPLLLHLHEVCCSPSSRCRPTFKEVLEMLEQGFSKYAIKVPETSAMSEQGSKQAAIAQELTRPFEILDITEQKQSGASVARESPKIETMLPE